MLRSVSIFVLLLLVVSCGGDGGGGAGGGGDPTGPPPAPQPVTVALQLSATSGSPAATVLVTFPGQRPAGETVIQATLGGEPLSISVVDPVTGAFAIPEGSPGQRQLEVPLADLEIGVATLTVLAPPVIANPQEVVDQTIDEMTSLVAALATSIREGESTDPDAGTTQAAALEEWAADLRADIEGASAAEIEELAQFLAANAEYFPNLAGLAGGPSYAAAGLDVDAETDAFIRDWLVSVGLIVGTIWVCSLAVVGSVGLLGPVCVGAVLGQAILLGDRLEGFYRGTVVVPVDLVQLLNQANAVQAEDIPSLSPSNSLPFDLDHGVPESYRFSSRNRTLTGGDRGIAPELFGILDTFAEHWNTIYGWFPVAARVDAFSLNGTATGRTEVVTLPAGSVRFDRVVGAGVSCTSNPIDSGVSLDCRNSTTSSQSVTLSFSYSNRFGSVSSDVAATVHAPQPGSIQAVTGGGQTASSGSAFTEELSVQLNDLSGQPLGHYPVSWSVVTGNGTILSPETETDDSGTARATVQAGAAGGLTVMASSTDRTGSTLTASFNLTSVTAAGTATLRLTGLSAPTTFFGDGFIGSQCSVTLVMDVEGNAPVRFVRRGFTITPLDGSEPFTEITPIDFLVDPPTTLEWLTDWRFWNGAFAGFSQTMWVEYTVNDQPTQTTTESWTCQPPLSASATMRTTFVSAATTFQGDGFIGSECSVSVAVDLVGNAPIQFVRRGFTITPLDGTAPFTEITPMDGAWNPPTTLEWITDWRFWNGSSIGFSQTMWAEYTVSNGPVQRTSTSWTCAV